MTRDEGLDLVARLRRAAAVDARVGEVTGPDARAFTFVDGPEAEHLGTFRITLPAGRQVYAVFCAERTATQAFWIFDRPRSSPTITTVLLQDGALVWRFIPVRQDGRNDARKARFRALVGADRLSIRLPDVPPDPFLADVERALDARAEAMNVEGAHGEPLPRAWFASETDRARAAARLVGSIRLAHDAHPACWTLTAPQGGPLTRLNVGVSRVLDLTPEGFALAVRLTPELAAAVAADDRLRLTTAGALSEQRVGPNALLEGAHRALNDLPEVLVEAHERLILDAAQAGTPFASSHRADFVSALRTVFDPTLPEPERGAAVRETSYWKVSPGEAGVDFPAWRAGGYAAVDWSAIGDLCAITSEAAFVALAAEAGVTARAARPLWHFRDLRAGDRIVANAGTRRVLALGTVVGDAPYHYASGEAMPHRVRVRWDDTTPRTVDMPGSKMALARLTREDFDRIARPVGPQPPPPAPMLAVPEGGLDFETILASLSERSLHFPEWLVAAYLLALQVRRFVLLTGISGTGKTQLALQLAALYSGGEQAGSSRFAVVPVHPDWTDTRSLLGFHNVLTGAYVRTQTLELVLRATADHASAIATGRSPRPYFLIFDEMNLARVEHYFADFLSAMESGQAIPLHDEPTLAAGPNAVPRSLALPPNLFVVGTVNIDETTHAFSPKVLDRAFVLEFNEVRLDLLGAGAAALAEDDDTPLTLSNLGDGLRLLGRATDDEYATFRGLVGGAPAARLDALHTALVAANRHFGYRVAREIARFVGLAAEQTDGEAESHWAALDIAVLGKVLPKLHGPHAELQPLLESLLRVVEMPPALAASAAKLRRMLDRARHSGYASFIE